jgi:hypothetical protein
LKADIEISGKYAKSNFRAEVCVWVQDMADAQAGNKVLVIISVEKRQQTSMIQASWKNLISTAMGYGQDGQRIRVQFPPEM